MVGRPKLRARRMIRDKMLAEQAIRDWEGPNGRNIFPDVHIPRRSQLTLKDDERAPAAATRHPAFAQPAYTPPPEVPQEPHPEERNYRTGWDAKIPTTAGVEPTPVPMRPDVPVDMRIASERLQRYELDRLRPEGPTGGTAQPTQSPIPEHLSKAAELALADAIETLNMKIDRFDPQYVKLKELKTRAGATVSSILARVNPSSLRAVPHDQIAEILEGLRAASAPVKEPS